MKGALSPEPRAPSFSVWRALPYAGLLVIFLGLPAFAQETPYAPTRMGQGPMSPDQEARVMILGKQLRCAVCQGVSIADSPASMARAQLDKVRELVAEGKSDQEIRDYFVTRYGEWALLEPTKTGLNGFLWLAPVAMLVLGAILIMGQVKKGAAPKPTAPADPPADDEFLAQVKKDLES
jgi:cytochrome c-type biogenesis protein CcmH